MENNEIYEQIAEDLQIKIWYSIEYPGTTLNLAEGIEPPEGYTDVTPIEGTIYQRFNYDILQWETDTAKENQAKIDEIVRQLEILDREYLTPRVLGGIGIGDDYAINQRKKHEVLAAPLRQQIEVLKDFLIVDSEQ